MEDLIMTDANELNQLTRKMYLNYQQDGLIEIVAGAAIMGLGAWYFNASTALAFLSLTPILFYSRLKNWITVPRLGVLKISPKAAGNKPVLGLLAVLTVALLAGMLLGVLGAVGLLSANLATFFKQPSLMVVLFTILLIGIAGTARAFRSGGIPVIWYARVFLYAGIYLAIIIADIGFRLTNGLVVIATGGIILLAGIGLLLVFLYRNPVSHIEES
jgi:hypothetical protein